MVKETKKIREKNGRFMMGHKHSDKIKEKISKKTKGRKETMEQRKNKSKRMKLEYSLGIRKSAMKGKKLTKEKCKERSRLLKEVYKEGRRKPVKMFGKENPAWNGGSSFEPYDKNWTKEFRRLIRKRDNQICILCETHREKLKQALHVHHVNYSKKITTPENCISLCNSCHSKTNENRKQWIMFFHSLLSEKYNYAYKKEVRND